MKIFKEIDIAEPIWKFKAIGLAVDDVPMGENVRVTISYISKQTGKQIYPGTYDIEVDKIRTYPVEKVRGNVRVHIVPIADLAKLTIFNTNQNQSNMLFGKDQLGKIIKESEEAKAGNYDNKKMLTPGKYVMTMIAITLSKAKDGNSMVVADFQLDDEHRPIKEFMKIAGPNTDIPREKLVKLFHRGFGYEIQPCQDEAGLMNQLKGFEGKKLAVAVKGKKAAYCFEKDGQDIVMEQTYPEFWYCGLESELGEMSFDESKAIKELTDDDKEKLVRFAEMNGGPYQPKGSSDANSGTTAPQPAPAPANPTPAPVAAAPVSTPEPAPAAPVAETPPAQPIEQEAPAAPAAEQPKAGGDDDFPF